MTENQITKEPPLAAPTGAAYLVDTSYSGVVEYPTVSKALEEERVISISKCEDGRFELRESCDEYFAAYLTREQLVAWANEILNLAAAQNDAAGQPPLPPMVTLPDVTREIGFGDLLGKGTDMPEVLRRSRWEEWKKLCPACVANWSPEGCDGCKHLQGDWCGLRALPAAVHPILSFRHGLSGKACMGAGYEGNAKS